MDLYMNLIGNLKIQKIDIKDNDGNEIEIENPRALLGMKRMFWFDYR